MVCESVLWKHVVIHTRDKKKYQYLLQKCFWLEMKFIMWLAPYNVDNIIFLWSYSVHVYGCILDEWCKLASKESDLMYETQEDIGWYFIEFVWWFHFFFLFMFINILYIYKTVTQTVVNVVNYCEYSSLF